MQVVLGCQLHRHSPTVLSSVRPRVSNIETIQLEISRKEYAEILKDQTSIRRLRVIPIVVGGKNEGVIPEYRLFDVMPSGAPYKLGLRSTDILVAANDFIIYEPEKFKAYLMLLAREKEATIEIRRGANPMLFRYKFVD